MKTALKRGNDKFSAMTLKSVSGPIGLGNRPTSAKSWAIIHEKRENDKFLAMTLKHFSGLTGLVNRPKSPKLWVIAHEKGLKTRK